MAGYGININIKPDHSDLKDATKFFKEGEGESGKPRKRPRAKPAASNPQPMTQGAMPEDVNLQNMVPYGMTPAGQSLMRGLLERIKAMQNGM